MFSALHSLAQNCVANYCEPFAASKSVVINHGFSSLRISAAQQSQSVVAQIAGAETYVRENGRTVMLHARRSVGMWRNRMHRQVEAWSDVSLNSEASWMINIRGGLESLEADLLDIWCPMLHICGGMVDGNIVLGKPQQTSLINIRGGVRNLRIVRPKDVQVHLHVRGGSTNVVVDDVNYQRNGSNLTIGNSQAKGRYDIIIGGGADNLTVNTFED